MLLFILESFTATINTLLNFNLGSSKISFGPWKTVHKFDEERSQPAFRGENSNA